MQYSKQFKNILSYRLRLGGIVISRFESFRLFQTLSDLLYSRVTYPSKQNCKHEANHLLLFFWMYFQNVNVQENSCYKRHENRSFSNFHSWFFLCAVAHEKSVAFDWLTARKYCEQTKWECFPKHSRIFEEPVLFTQ